METFALIVLLGIGSGIIVILLVQLQRTQDELEALLQDPSYGISSRQGLDRRWRRVGKRYAQGYDVVFIDIDKLHSANEQFGYEEVNRRLREALNIRVSDQLIFDIGRWFSGDEIGCIVPRCDGEGVAKRLQARLKAEGFSATFGIVSAQPELSITMNKASKLVQLAKIEGRRGSINKLEIFSMCPV